LVEHQSQTYVVQQSVTKIISLTFVNLVTPKAQAKPELLFNKPASEDSNLKMAKIKILNRSSKSVTGSKIKSLIDEANEIEQR
jgi:hypothetical protein